MFLLAQESAVTAIAMGGSEPLPSTLVADKNFAFKGLRADKHFSHKSKKKIGHDIILRKAQRLTYLHSEDLIVGSLDTDGVCFSDLNKSRHFI